MKTKTLLLATSLMIGTASTANLPAGQAGTGTEPLKNYSINTKTSKVIWTATKVGGSHTGTIDIANGNITTKNGGIHSADITMDMKSIHNTDLEDAGYRAKLEGHLKSDDFFAVEKFAKASFKVTTFTTIPKAKQGASNYTITGDLTIKGITHSVSFPGLVVINGDKATINGTLTFDRSKWEVKFGSGSFFAGLGDNLIYDDVDLKFELYASVSEVN